MRKLYEKPLPRGHAYMHFRNAGSSIHVDFPDLKVEWLDEIIMTAMRAFNADEEEALRKQQEPTHD